MRLSLSKNYVFRQKGAALQDFFWAENEVFENRKSPSASSILHSETSSGGKMIGISSRLASRELCEAFTECYHFVIDIAGFSRYNSKSKGE